MKQRNYAIDLIKCLGALFVVFVHFFLYQHFYTTPIEGGHMLLGMPFRWLFYCCIPLFLLATGYLNSKAKPTKVYFKKIIPFLLSYVLISIITIFFLRFVMDKDRSFFYWLQSIFSYRVIDYAWYVELYIGLFLLIPFLNVGLDSLNKKQFQTLIIIMILLTSLPSFFASFSVLGLKAAFLPLYWQALYPLTYYLIGSYMKRFQITISSLKLLMICLVSWFFLSYYSFSVGKGSTFPFEVFPDYGTFPVLVLAVSLFGLFLKIPLKKGRFSSFLAVTSSITYELFLFSFLFDQLFYKVIFPTSTFEQGLSFWFIPFLTFICSWVCAFFLHTILQKIFPKKGTIVPQNN